MHLERIRFDRVFDTAPGRGDFSYESGGQVHFGVRLDNGVIPRPGSTYAVAFAAPGDWARVLGWRDLAADRVSLSQPLWSALLAELSDFIWFAPFFVFAALLLAGLAAAGLMAAIVAGIGIHKLVLLVRRNREVERALLAAAR